MQKNGPASLSVQQRNCLRLVAKGLSSPEIAHELGISQSTVNGHLAAAVAKLGVPNRRRAAAVLAEHDAVLDTRQKIPGDIVRVDQPGNSAPSPVPSRVREATGAPVFDPDVLRAEPKALGRGEDGYNDVNTPLRTPLRTVATVLLIALTIIIIIVAIGPLTQSAIQLAKVINSLRH